MKKPLFLFALALALTAVVYPSVASAYDWEDEEDLYGSRRDPRLDRYELEDEGSSRTTRTASLTSRSHPPATQLNTTRITRRSGKELVPLGVTAAAATRRTRNIAPAGVARDAAVGSWRASSPPTRPTESPTIVSAGRDPEERAR